MKKKKIRNPLLRRIPRELAGDWRKYLVIFLFLTLMIGFVSGMYVANDSMLTSNSQGRTKYNLEDGRLTFSKKPSQKLLDAVEAGDRADIRAWMMDQAEQKVREQNLPEPYLSEAVRQARKKASEEYGRRAGDEKSDFTKTPVTLYENNYKELTEKDGNSSGGDTTVRVYKIRTDVDRPCVMSGRLPEKSGEIAIDRMHADNQDVKVGDTIMVGLEKMKVTGLIALPDYSTLFKKNTDVMFDALTFDVALVTDGSFDRLNAKTVWCWSWQYKDRPGSDDEKADRLSRSFMQAAASNAAVNDNELSDYIPAYQNQAITFAPEDMGGDKTMGGYLLYILILVIAFIFGVTISNTITGESRVIGTLRASGYTKGELIRHYMSMPVIVTLVSAVVGNILGYTAFKYLIVSMYYNSYSLPTYVTYWNAEAFVKTTVVPVVIMIVVDLLIITRKLSYSPQDFLNRDFSRNKKKKAVKLRKGSFMGRFRLRVLFQNIPNYAVILIGICFVMLMMVFVTGFLDSLHHYQDVADWQVLADYQYVLTSDRDGDGNIIQTDNKDAEKISVQELVTDGGARDGEDITIYGIRNDSRYIRADMEKLNGDEVLVSESYAGKFRLRKGSNVRLRTKYTGDSYTFRVKGIYNYNGALAVFLPQDEYNETFDEDSGYFNGYLSDSKITDIDSDSIARTLTRKDITSVVRQLDHSMGSYMLMYQYLCIILAAILIYLLTKVIIERNASSISMAKILGYKSSEIASLYIIPTMWAVIASEIIGLFVANKVIGVLWRMFLNTMSGWIPYYVQTRHWFTNFALVFIAYLAVTLIDYRRIRRIPMDTALKNAE